MKNEQVLCLKYLDKYLAFLGIIMVSLFILLHTHSKISFIYSDIIQLITPLICGVVYFGVSRRIEPSINISFRLIGLASFIWAAGQMIWIYDELVLGMVSPFPGLAHAGFTMSSLVLSIGIFKRLSFAKVKGQNYKILLNVSILMTIVVAFLWYFEIGPFIAQWEVSLLGFLLVFVEPVLQMGLIAAMLFFLYSYESRMNLTAFMYTLIGVICLVIVNAKFVYDIGRAVYQTGFILDALWPLAFVFLSLAALAEDGKHVLEDKKQQGYFKTKVVLDTLPYMAILSIPGLFTINYYWPGNHISVIGILICSTLLLILVGVRQFLMIRERDQMVKRVEDSSKSLRKQIERLQWIDDISNVFSNTLDLNQLLKMSIDQVQKLGICDGCWIGLYNQKNNVIECKAVSSSAKIFFLELPCVGLGSGLTGKVGELKRPIITNEPALHAYFENRVDIHLSGYLGLPLLVEKRLLGVLILYNWKGIRKFSFEDLRLMLTLARSLAIAIDNANLYQNIQTTNMNTLVAFARAIESKSSYTQGHSQRVADLSRKMALKLGFEDKRVENLYQGALLHDIGKIGVEDHILNKKGFLTAEEYTVIKRHPALGIDIISPISQFKSIIPMIHAHHERNDGSGYPLGLSGDEISLEAKIISVADTFDAITSNRPYRGAQSYSYALEEIERNTPTKYERNVVESLKYIINEENKADKTS